jgi:hypothetical protein
VLPATTAAASWYRRLNRTVLMAYVVAMFLRLLDALRQVLLLATWTSSGSSSSQLTRVLRGRKGAFVIQMDLGSAEKCAEDGINQPQPRNIPWETPCPDRGLIMEAVQRAEGTTSKRPDGLLYKPRKGTDPAEYWIIEVKIRYGDADPQGQQSKADYQHEKLMEKIKEIDPTAKVWYYPLFIGVAGTIYMNTSMYLEALGIKGEALKKCKSDIYQAAIKFLHSIYVTKRKLEKPKEEKWHRRSTKVS